MAKLESSLGQLRGKHKDTIYIKDGKVKAHTRTAVPAKSEKRLEVLRKQHSRNKPLNQLGIEINNCIRKYAGSFKPSDFYRRLHKRFRKTESNNRFLLLNELKGMEINEQYKLDQLGQCVTGIKKVKNNIAVELRVTSHPFKESRRIVSYSSYYYEVVLVYWNKSKKPGVHARRRTDWIDIKGKLPVFDFEFKNAKGATHWLLCVQLCLGENRKSIGIFPSMGMKITDVGSFDKNDLKLIAEEQKIVKSKPAGSNEDEDLELVKPRRTG